jgi:hypothetical protein
LYEGKEIITTVYKMCTVCRKIRLREKRIRKGRGRRNGSQGQTERTVVLQVEEGEEERS